MAKRHGNATSSLARREFLRTILLGSAVSSFIREGWIHTVLADCRPSQSSNGILRLRISDYPVLQNENGSIRLSFNPFSTGGPNGAFYPVLINRGSDDQFFSLSADCQHQHCVVSPFNAGAGASVCPCHGSRYGIDGKVLRGPTTRPLIPYASSFDGTTLCVEIPGLGFEVTASDVQDGINSRFQLSFSTKANVNYQVLLRESIADEGSVIPFATQLDGEANSTTLRGTGSNATVFLDRTAESGFYSVAVQVTQN